ncbi:MAG: hypothetical protein WCC12_02000 [Anaerolineales bacterium]
MRTLLLGNPWFRTIIPLLLAGVISVFTNSLVVEISNGDKVFWYEMPKTSSFYILIVSTLLLAVYQFQLFKHDSLIPTGLTQRQYKALIREMIADDIAGRCKQLIRDGRITQLKKESEVFSILFGELGNDEMDGSLEIWKRSS